MDESKLMEFMGKLVADMGGAAMLASVIVGNELGLYRAMADNEPVTADALAERTGCQPRLTLEWLNAQAASGYVEYDNGSYRLPEEQALALAVEDSPVFVAGGAVALATLSWTKTSRWRRCAATGRSRGAITIRVCSAEPRSSSDPATRPTWCPRGCPRSTG